MPFSATEIFEQLFRHGSAPRATFVRKDGGNGSRGIRWREPSAVNPKAWCPQSPKENLAEAFQYLRNHWDALRVYLGDGRVPIDNNEVEQLMKQVALGRKNWLFIGSVAAGARAADFLTLVSSALRNDLDVYAYLKAVLDALLAGSTDYANLRPDRWAIDHPAAIRQYRQKERRERYEAKATRRAVRRQPPPIKR